jgi:lysophospholipase L1-like esterase
MHRLTIAAVAVAAVAVAAAAVLASTASARTTTAHYYLALGDSLSQGIQPNAQGQTQDTNEGYTDDLWQIEQAHVPNLQLVKLGCGGETTTSMLTGKGNEANVRKYHCTDRTGGSQLAAAVRFLKAHHQPGEVPLVTIDIGANDVDGCATATNVLTCVSNGVASIGTNLPKILSALKHAAPPGTKFAGMTLYDSTLGGYFSPSGTTAHSLAVASVALLKTINQKLTEDDQAAGFKTADVAGAFDTYDSTDTVTWEGQQIPIDVSRVCSWTWACQTPPSGPNIHANKNGYAVIAGAFAEAIGRLS